MRGSDRKGSLRANGQSVSTAVVLKIRMTSAYFAMVFFLTSIILEDWFSKPGAQPRWHKGKYIKGYIFFISIIISIFYCLLEYVQKHNIVLILSISAALYWPTVWTTLIYPSPPEGPLLSLVSPAEVFSIQLAVVNFTKNFLNQTEWSSDLVIILYFLCFFRVCLPGLIKIPFIFY